MSPVLPTTIVHAPKLAALLGVELTLAVETFQVTGSFKFRAAWRVASTVEAPHLLTASSGNFGQALARACAILGKRCTVVMPARSAKVKIDAVRADGATVDLIEGVPRAARVAELAREHPEAYVASPYDDELVIDGNATLGVELAPLGFDLVVAPIGGGGLASGLLRGLRAAGSGAAVWAAEPLAANDAARSLRAGKIEHNPPGEPDTIADGARTPSLGEHNWAVLKEGLAGIVEVPEAALADGVRRLFALANLKAEPTGALAVAALAVAPEQFRGKRVCAVISGGNVDPGLYARLIAG